MSAEGAALVETQTNALFGDVKALTRQMQEAVGNVSSLEEVMQKVQVRVDASTPPTLCLCILCICRWLVCARAGPAVGVGVGLSTAMQTARHNAHADWAFQLIMPGQNGREAQRRYSLDCRICT